MRNPPEPPSSPEQGELWDKHGLTADQIEKISRQAERVAKRHQRHQNHRHADHQDVRQDTLVATMHRLLDPKTGSKSGLEIRKYASAVAKKMSIRASKPRRKSTARQEHDPPAPGDVPEQQAKESDLPSTREFFRNFAKKLLDLPEGERSALLLDLGVHRNVVSAERQLHNDAEFVEQWADDLFDHFSAHDPEPPPHTEVARKLDKNVRAVTQRISVARRRLRGKCGDPLGP